MAYLTNYTYGFLCRKTRVGEVSKEDFLNTIYDNERLYYIFNRLQRDYLFIYKSLLDNEDEFLVTYYEEVPAKEDTKQYVFERQEKRTYHLYNDYETLNNDFSDYNIPSEIRSLGDNAVEDYRKWFKANAFHDKYINCIIDVGAITFQYNMYFPEKYGVKRLNEKFKLIETKPNSNNESIEEYDLEKFYKRIDYLIEAFYNEFSDSFQRKISKFDYLSRKSTDEVLTKMNEVMGVEFMTNYTIHRAKQKIVLSANLKSELTKELVEYIKWSYDLKNKNFKIGTLKRLGLKCCKKCQDK